MSRYYNYYKNFTQPSEAELKRKQEASKKKAAKKGKTLDPIIVLTTGRNVCTSWWGKEWCRNLESYADFQNRLSRGKRYVRTGCVIDLKIKKGVIHALVQGSRGTPYRITIRISPLSEKKIEKIVKACHHKLDSLEKLIEGTFPKDMQELFLSEDGLFPKPSEIDFNCSCPDYAYMCKHIAASLYGVGVRLDEDPLLFFELRGIDPQQFIKGAITSRVESMLKNENKPSDRTIDEEKITDIFGVL